MNGKDTGIDSNSAKPGFMGLFRKNATLPDPGCHPGLRAAVPVCAEVQAGLEIQEALAGYQWNR